MPFRMLGVTDERDTCELCGKQHLKRCVVLEDTDAGGIVYYGTDCAARVLMPKANDRVTRKEAGKLDELYDGVMAFKKNYARFAAGELTEKQLTDWVWNKYGGQIGKTAGKWYYKTAAGERIEIA